MEFTRYLLRAFTFRCPNCGVGRMQRKPYVFNHDCDQCGYRYLPDDGDFWGGVVIAYTFGGIIGFIGVGLLVAFTDLSVANLVYATAAIVVASIFLLFPFCKSLYAYLMFRFRGHEEEYRPPAMPRTR
jgi:uncharacterized protein (DUF983 family)